ncbi:MAG: DUF1097 domain-containing protein [Peptostreptococcus sp.]|uniref:DUF1097 domain-containing protein n=1 Tax=Peptostreptococcus sp. TaxID=1262 RepID=UPI002FC9232A
MSFLLALSLSTGFFCGVWAAIAAVPSLGLITWAGFAGCTAYFASGKHGIEGMSAAIFSTMSGVVSALIALFISGKFPGIPVVAILMTGIISGTMCLKSAVKPLWFIPGAFIGCFSTFAYVSTGVNIFSAALLPHVLSILSGSILALCCDKGGNLLFKVFGKQEDTVQEDITQEHIIQD